MLTRSSTRGKTLKWLRLAPAVAGLVEVEAHAVAVQVDDVGGAGAVDVGQADALLVELVGVVEPGRVVHRHLGAEAAVAEVGPVADLAVADAHEVGQAVAAHVGEVDRLRAVGEDEARAFLLVQRLGDAPGRAEAFLASEACQTKASSSVISTSAWPSPSRSTNLRLGSRRSRLRRDGEGAEGLPAFSLVVLVEAGRRAVQHHQVELAVAGQVHELARRRSGRGWA